MQGWMNQGQTKVKKYRFLVDSLVAQLPGDISMMKNLRSLAPNEETSIDVVETKLTI